LCGVSWHAGDKHALQIIENAKLMAFAVSKERDVLDSQWRGINGQNPLWQLLGTTDLAETGEVILNLISSLEDLVATEPTLNEIPVPAKVFGDLHGQFRDVLLFLFHYGFPDGKGYSFVFNGDWVDRGSHQMETICLIYALKLAFPDKVWLNRGNHEDESQNVHMGKEGFAHACIQQLGPVLGQHVFSSFAMSYQYLPLATLLGESILVLHGGIGDGQWDLSYLDDLERPINHEAMARDKVVYNILWSDPIDEDTKGSFGVHDSPRDGHARLVISFGADVTREFCARNGLGMIIRSHEAKSCGDGYECMHGEHLMRVFSARDYGNGSMRNDGSILNVAVKDGRLLVTPQMLKSLTKK
jgi:hypothetical protein